MSDLPSTLDMKVERLWRIACARVDAGGAGTLFGPLVGAIILVPLREFSNSLLGGGGSGMTYILFGGIIMLIARFEPGGLMEIGRRIADALRRRPADSKTGALDHAA